MKKYVALIAIMLASVFALASCKHIKFCDECHRPIVIEGEYNPNNSAICQDCFDKWFAGLLGSSNTNTETGFTYEDDEEHVGLKITGYNGVVPTRLEIPESIDGERVVSIGAYAFSDCKNIETLIIPDNVDYIYSGAFINCTSLKTVEFPKNDTVALRSDDFMGEEIFRNCSVESLSCCGGQFDMDKDSSILRTVKHLTITGGNVQMYEYSNSNAPCLETVYFDKGDITVFEGGFAGIETLKSVVCHEEGQVGFAMGAFSSCSSLETVVFSSGSSLFDQYAFSWCAIKELVIPANMNEISTDNFSGCPIESVVFEEVDGWTCNGEPLSSETVSDPQLMAEYFISEEIYVFIKQ